MATMFGAFRFNEDTRKPRLGVRLSQRNNATDARGYALAACDACRSKKLRCSGDQECCDRCRLTSTTCTYTINSAGSAGRKRLIGLGPRLSLPSEQRQQEQRPPDSAENGLDSGRQGTMCGDKDGQDAGSGADNPRGGNGSDRGEGSNPADYALLLPQVWGQSAAKSNPQPRPAPAKSYVPGCDPLGMDFHWEDPDDPLADSQANSNDDAFNHVDAEDQHMHHGFDHEPVLLSSMEHGIWPSASSSILDLPAVTPSTGFTEATTSASSSSDAVTAPSTHSECSAHSSSNSIPPAAELRTGACSCARSLTLALGDIGNQRAAARGPAGGIDALLICLQSGVAQCKSVLACGQCTTALENLILIAVILQQLGSVSADAGQLLQRMWNRGETRPEQQGGADSNAVPATAAADAAAIPPPDNEKSSAREAGNISSICIGRYRIQQPEMEFRLVSYVVAMLLVELDELVKRFKLQVIAAEQKREAWRLVTDAEEKTSQVLGFIANAGLFPERDS